MNYLPLDMIKKITFHTDDLTRTMLFFTSKKFNFITDIVIKKDICGYACEEGYLHILKYLHENKYPWDEEFFTKAAKNGHLHILIYLQENNYINNKYLRNSKCGWDEFCYKEIGKNSHLEIIYYIYNKMKNKKYITK